MDALMAAFVAALFTQATDRTPWLAGILGDRYGRSFGVVIGTILALTIGNAIAAVGGTLVAHQMSPNAKDLFLAIALLFGGVGAFFPIKAPDRLSGWKIGAFLTSLFGIFILAFGDRSQFITAAITARSPSPVFAAIGATLGSIAVHVPAILAGERSRKQMPITGIRIGVGILFVLFGLYLGLGAIRVI